MNISAATRETIAAHLNLDPGALDDDARFFTDLRADSLTLMELALALELRFDMDIPNEDVPRLVTIGDAVAHCGAPANTTPGREDREAVAAGGK